MRAQQLELAPAEWKWVAAILVIVAIGLANPVGFGGGGADDGRYLVAAQCWLAHGPCVPTNHWEGRWPVVGSLALALGLFGSSEFTAALPSLVAAGLCLVQLTLIGNRLFGSPVGYVAAAVLAATPTFIIEATHPAVEPIELAFVLAAALLTVDRRPLLAGIALGMAFQTRETAVAALAPFAWMMRRDRRALAMFGAGFLLPLAAEVAVYGLWINKPLLRFQLSIAHTSIPSSELRHYDGKWPFLNRSLLENWRYEPGLRVHWLVDGFVNLFVNFKTNLLFLVTPILLAFYRPKGTRQIAFLVASAFAYAAVLIYVLCIDPKPRMFTPALAALALAFAAIAWRCRGPVIAAMIIAIVPLSLVVLQSQPRMRHWRAAGEQWVRQFPGKVSTPHPDYFAFSPELSSLPTRGGSYSLRFEEHGCRGPVVREQRSNRVAVLLGDPQALCLYSSAALPKTSAALPATAS